MNLTDAKGVTPIEINGETEYILEMEGDNKKKELYLFSKNKISRKLTEIPTDVKLTVKQTVLSRYAEENGYIRPLVENGIIGTQVRFVQADDNGPIYAAVTIR